MEVSSLYDPICRSTESNCSSRATCKFSRTFPLDIWRLEFHLSHRRDKSRMQTLIKPLLLAALLLIPTFVSAQNPTEAEEEEVTKDGSPKGFQFKFKDRPSFRY